jgi:signal-transduction protein with cAMP-binding, CBS, and nucleotidyltransferase domain
MSFRAKDLAERDFISLTREASVLEAARAMKVRRHGYIVVVSRDGVPEGIATEWDFVDKVIAEGRDTSTTKLGDIMSTGLVTVKAGDAFEDVTLLMVRRGIRRVLVLEDGKVLGIVTAKIVMSKLKEYVDKISSQIARMQSPPA